MQESTDTVLTKTKRQRMRELACDLFTQGYALPVVAEMIVREFGCTPHAAAKQANYVRTVLKRQNRTERPILKPEA